MSNLGEFTLKRIDDDWQQWELWHGDRKLLDVGADVAKGIMLRRYDVDALARGELILRADTERISEREAP